MQTLVVANLKAILISLQLEVSESASARFEVSSIQIHK